jgi:hypothetical protein
VPLYHRLLRLRHFRPGSVLTFVFFEGSVIVAAVLSFAEILQWWSVLAVPAAVAACVKFNDLVAGLPTRLAPRPPRAARGVAQVPSVEASRPPAHGRGEAS